MPVTKRPLPPTPSTSPKYTNVNGAIQSLLLETDYDNLTDRERKWYNDICNCHKALEQKDSIISNLKTIVMEWKKKAIDYENAFKEANQKLQDREQFLIKQHKAEIEAITKAQAEQVNEHLELILHLEQENQVLLSQQPSKAEQQQQLPNSITSSNDTYTSSTSQLCNEAKMAHAIANETVSSGKEDAEVLIQRINDMMHAMEGTLDDFKNSQEQPYSKCSQLDELTNSICIPPPPPLISDSSYSSSDESTDEMLPPETVPVYQPASNMTKKKRSIRSANIPNFLFRNNSSSKNNKRANSLNQEHRVQRKSSFMS